MKLHEYQAKDLLRANGVKVPPGIAATTTDAGRRAAAAAKPRARTHSNEGRGR